MECLGMSGMPIIQRILKSLSSSGEEQVTGCHKQDNKNAVLKYVEIS